MKYLLLIYLTENAMSEPEREQCYKDSTNLANELHAGGQFLGANPLQPVATATSLRVREGKRQVTDGPFAETREQLGGYFLIDAPIWIPRWGSPHGFPRRKRGRLKFGRCWRYREYQRRSDADEGESTNTKE